MKDGSTFTRFAWQDNSTGVERRRQKIQWLLARCPRFLHSFHDYILRVDYILSAARHRGCTDGIKTKNKQTKKKLTPDLIVLNIIVGERQNQGGRKSVS